MEGSALRPKLNPSNPEGFYYYQELLEHFNSVEVRLTEPRRAGGLDNFCSFPFLELDVQYEIRKMYDVIQQSTRDKIKG